MAGSTSLIARRSIRSRLGRRAAIIVAVMAGVSFVSGSFVLADSLKSSIDGFISELVQNTDLVVRAERAFDQDEFQGDSAREPIPIEIADGLRDIPGVDIVEPDIQRNASVLDADGAVITTTGPQFGVVWDGESLAGVTLKEGRKPSGADELVLDKATADRENFALGDTVGYVTDAGSYEGTLVGTIGTEDTDSLFGATIVALDLPTALDHYGANGRVDGINLSVVDDNELDTVKAAVQAAVPDGIEVIDRLELIEESKRQDVELLPGDIEGDDKNTVFATTGGEHAGHWMTPVSRNCVMRALESPRERRTSRVCSPCLGARRLLRLVS